MFKNEQQRAAVCDCLCAEARLRERMWTTQGPDGYPGPTKAAVQVRSGKFPLSPGERKVVLAAWDIWNGSGKVKVGDLMYGLDRHNLETLGSCLTAMANGPHAIDLWLLKHSPFREDTPRVLTTT